MTDAALSEKSQNNGNLLKQIIVYRFRCAGKSGAPQLQKPTIPDKVEVVGSNPTSSAFYMEL